MWEARTRSVPSGTQYRVFRDETSLSVRELFELLENDTDFRDWYSRTLAASPYVAYFWEFPPLTVDRLGDDAEFVLIESQLLANLPPDPAPFQSHFAPGGGDDVVSFPNLGGDAFLIVPTPQGPVEAYPHLAAFLRKAPGDQIDELWRTAARETCRRVSDSPLWLSTAGLGVAWLHLRLDTRPKYYSYAPYKSE